MFHTDMGLPRLRREAGRARRARQSERTAAIDARHFCIRDARAYEPQCSCAERLGRGSVWPSALCGVFEPKAQWQLVRAQSAGARQRVLMGDPTSPRWKMGPAAAKWRAA